MPISLFLDCGAPSLYNQLSRAVKSKGVMGTHIKNRRLDDFSYIKTKEYLSYRDNYIKFILENKDVIDVYSNLDVINNPSETWNNQKYLESKGLRPIPVFHFGGDPKWLKMYINKGYEYIAIGGMVPNPTTVLVPGLDELWDKYLTDDKGMPIVKIHGFAMTSVRLMWRYPWYSVDSTTWVVIARNGGIYIPQFKKGKWLYDVNPLNISVSSRSPSKKEAGQHIDTFSPAYKKVILTYLDKKGYTVGKSKFRMKEETEPLEKNERWHGPPLENGKREVEMIIEPGICNDYKLRDELNIIYFTDLEKAMPKWPWPIKKRTEARKGFGL